ncbi:response regulator [Flavihumibacter sp. R14]|nr:response regulator [Flavihumibacter soli]
MRSLKKILLVDDDRRNIFALNAVLKARGFLCETASGAFQGIEKLNRDNDIGIILMDIMMPGMDGYEAIARIRGNRATAEIPIIAVTAQAMAGDKERCLAAGANGYVSKPVDVDLLMKLLNEHLR